jgi:hypothetical protein
VGGEILMSRMLRKRRELGEKKVEKGERTW